MSFGTTMNSEVLHKAIKDAYEEGILIVASAGNNGSAIEYPAAYDEVMAVGSVDSNGKLSTTSARGEELEIVAPGESVKSTGSFGGNVFVSGTSISVPHIVGVASILWEKDKNCSNEFIRELLKQCANKSTDKLLEDNGIVELEYALNIYDEFKENYIEGKNEENICEENKNIVYTEDVESIEARWVDGDHAVLAGKAGKTYSLTTTQIKILKKGSKYPDIYEPFSTMTNNPQWHTAVVTTEDNYISNYRCATLIARAINNGKKISSVNRPRGMKKVNYNKMIEQVDGILWTDALGDISATKKNKALFVIGMAMHAATDVYSHQSYVKVNGKWKHLNHEDDNCDSTSVYKSRYSLAQDVACDVLQCYLEGDTGDHWEFVQAYNGKVKYKRLVKYAKEQDTYNSNTFGELDTLKKGDVAYD